MTFHDVYWTVWIVLGFGGYETYALATGRPEKTLTHYFCRLFALFPRQKGAMAWRLRRALAIGFLGWLALHMLSMTMGGLF